MAALSEGNFVVPDLCNVAALSLVVLFAELLVVVLLLAGAEVSWVRFALLSFFVQWVALTSAGALCALRAGLARLPLAVGAVAAFLVVLCVTLLEGLLADRILVQFSDLPIDWQRIGTQVLISSIIAALVLRYFYVQQRLRAQEQAELQARIQALQSRIRPHFLFNSMNIIASLIATDPETAERVVEDLSELFRASLNEAGNQVALQDELDLCERYVRIESLRLGDRLQVAWDIEPLSGAVKIPLLTIQPLLENAIYHGIQPRAEGGEVSVTSSAEDDILVVTITNPLPEPNERNASGKLQGNQMAMDNIRSRLLVLYGEGAALKAREETETFITELRIPLSHGEPA